MNIFNTSTNDTDEMLRRAQKALNKDGVYPAKLLSSTELFDEERRRVFGKAWIYLGHKSEIPNVGDYMVRYIVDDQFIVTHDTEGELRALHNSCRHRGMQLCRADKGQAKRFTCPYHGWTYGNNGKLLAVPLVETLYPETFNRSDWNLLQIPALEVFHGMIFGSLNPDAPPLKDYLGDMAWYLEMMAGRTKDGLEVYGEPHRWVVEADWKIAADNFVGDAFHTATTHRSMLDGVMPRDALFAMKGEHIRLTNGHGLGRGSAVTPDGMNITQYGGLPEVMWPEIEATLSREQADVLKTTLHLHGTVFPNLSFLQVFEAPDLERPPTSTLTFRVWQPLAAGKMEIWSWFMVDRCAPEDHKQQSYAAYIRTFGSAGGFEQDDTENWRSITRVAKGQFAENAVLNYQMGQDMLEPDPNWTGPGKCYPRAFMELTQRDFHSRWLDYMTGVA